MSIVPVVDGCRQLLTDAQARRRELENVAAGRGTAALPLSSATDCTQPDVTWAQITEIPDNRVGLAWPAGRRDPLLTEFSSLAGDEEGVLR